jgi:hypothetical protein
MDSIPAALRLPRRSARSFEKRREIKMRKGLAILLVATVGTLSLAVGAAWLYAGRPHSLALGCSGCILEWRSMAITPSSLRLAGLRFFLGRREATAIEGSSPLVTIRFRPISLWSRKLEIVALEIASPSVHVIEGDERSSRSRERPLEGSAWRILAERTHAENGSFLYTRVYRGRTAAIRVSGIQASAGLWDSAREELWTEGAATGLLEGTGAFTLTVKHPIFATETRATVDLKIAGLALGGLNEYFRPSEGIELYGALIRGHGFASVEGNKQKARVSAQYQGLKIQFFKTKERSGLAAFFSNLIGSQKLAKSSPAGKSRAREVAIRRGDESMVSFLIRGARDSALRVATED